MLDPRWTPERVRAARAKLDDYETTLKDAIIDDVLTEMEAMAVELHHLRSMAGAVSEGETFDQLKARLPSAPKEVG